jgi:hypothetical protein
VFLAFYFGMKPYNRITILGTLLIGGLLPFIILMRRLEIGLIALIPVAFLVKYELGTGTNVPFNAAILMAAGLLGIMGLPHDRNRSVCTSSSIESEPTGFIVYSGDDAISHSRKCRLVPLG